MGVLDTEGKQYFSNNRFFADAFKFYCMMGKMSSKRTNWTKLIQRRVSFRMGIIPVFRFGGIGIFLKIWNVMENTIYVF